MAQSRAQTGAAGGLRLIVGTTRVRTLPTGAGRRRRRGVQPTERARPSSKKGQPVKKPWDRSSVTVWDPVSRNPSAEATRSRMATSKMPEPTPAAAPLSRHARRTRCSWSGAAAAISPPLKRSTRRTTGNCSASPDGCLGNQPTPRNAPGVSLPHRKLDGFGEAAMAHGYIGSRPTIAWTISGAGRREADQ